MTLRLLLLWTTDLRRWKPSNQVSSYQSSVDPKWKFHIQIQWQMVTLCHLTCSGIGIQDVVSLSASTVTRVETPVQSPPVGGLSHSPGHSNHWPCLITLDNTGQATCVHKSPSYKATTSPKTRLLAPCNLLSFFILYTSHFYASRQRTQTGESNCHKKTLDGICFVSIYEWESLLISRVNLAQDVELVCIDCKRA